VGFTSVVEFPWLFVQRLEGRMLDAGSALNHTHVLDRLLPRVESLHIATLAPEPHAFADRGVSYVYEDLRDLPYRGSYFDTIACISTLEHVGMDNRMYGATAPASAHPEHEAARAIADVRRVLALSGRLLSPCRMEQVRTTAGSASTTGRQDTLC
jgi:Methyltransferase domain